MSASHLPQDLYTAVQVRELDRQAIEVQGVEGLVLMQRAGRAAYDLMRDRWPDARKISIVCGLGNNAGDGYVVARLAQLAGLQVRVLQLGDSQRLKGDARLAFEQMLESGASPEPFRAEALEQAEIIVDGLLGTGLDRQVEGEWRAVIEAINAAACAVLSLDTPSGLNVDTGTVMGCAVKADATVTFIGMKQGMLTHQGPEHCGHISFNNLDVPNDIYQTLRPSSQALQLAQLNALLPPRAASAHKGDHGHALIIGGDQGYSGAVRMASEAAARTGAGLVSTATRGSHAHVVTLLTPEIMCHAVDDAELLWGLLERASSIGIGPGLAQESWGRGLYSRTLETRLPMVVDADALNLLAQSPTQRDNWVLTPHPGEAARLLGCSSAEVQSDRFAAVQAIQQKYGGVCVLKGNGTLVADGVSAVTICTLGNPGMASGGMGDVLTGIITALLAQGLSPSSAAQLGVCLHAAAGDRAAKDGQRGMLATDLLHFIRSLVNP